MSEFHTLENRYILDYEDVQREVRCILDQVKELRNDSFIKRILNKADRESMIKWENLIDKKMREPFSLVIIGDFKRGKSTLINSILGSEVVTTNVTPETVTINKIIYGDEPKAEAILTNGRRLRLSREELKRSELEKIIAELPEPIDYIEIKDSNPLLKDIEIVDTPGIGDIMKAFDQQVKDYMAKADAVLYVVSALSPISDSEQIFLNNAVLPHSFSRLFVVVNMIDCIDEEKDILRIKNSITEKVKAISGNASLFFVSGLDEYCRKLNMKRPNKDLTKFLENNYLEFETALQNDIILQKMIIKSERVIHTVKMMVKDMEGRIQLISSMLQNSREELGNLEDKYEQENLELFHLINKSNDILHNEFLKLKVEAKDWMEEFLNRLKEELKSIGSSQTTETLQKHLQFYLSDQIKEATLLCLKAHQEAIDKKLNEIMKDYTKNLVFGDISLNKIDMSIRLSDISWTEVDTASYLVGNGLSMIGLGGFEIITNAIAGFVRQNRLSKKQTDLIQPILSNFGQIITEIFASIDKAYNEIEKNAEDLIEQTYKNQLDKSLSAVKQAQEIAKTENIKSEEVQGLIENAMEILSSIHKSIDKF